MVQLTPGGPYRPMRTTGLEFACFLISCFGLST